jgi:hypothetical protein
LFKLRRSGGRRRVWEEQRRVREEAKEARSGGSRSRESFRRRKAKRSNRRFLIFVNDVGNVNYYDPEGVVSYYRFTICSEYYYLKFF